MIFSLSVGGGTAGRIGTSRMLREDVGCAHPSGADAEERNRKLGPQWRRCLCGVQHCAANTRLRTGYSARDLLRVGGTLTLLFLALVLVMVIVVFQGKQGKPAGVFAGAHWWATAALLRSERLVAHQWAPTGRSSRSSPRWPTCCQ
jgi:hypothetical protein